MCNGSLFNVLMRFVVMTDGCLGAYMYYDVHAICTCVYSVYIASFPCRQAFPLVFFFSKKNWRKERKNLPCLQFFYCKRKRKRKPGKRLVLVFTGFGSIYTYS